MLFYVKFNIVMSHHNLEYRQIFCVVLYYDEVIVLFANFSLSFIRFIKAGKVNRLISLLSHIIQYEDGIATANCLYLSFAYFYVSTTYAYSKSRTHRTSFV